MPRKKPEPCIAFNPKQGVMYVFLPHPQVDGMWFRTHPCTITMPCHCGADIGEPCRGTRGQFTSSVHSDRITTHEGWAKKVRAAALRERLNHDSFVRKILGRPKKSRRGKR